MLSRRGRPAYLALTMPSLLVAMSVILGLAPAAAARSAGDYDLTWNSADGGGWTFSSGGDYSLGGTVGQPDAGVLAGGDYSLAGGFWGGAASPYRVYLPLLWRDS